jgi:hypothetical protein
VYVEDVGMSNGIGSCCLSFDPMAGCFEHYVKVEAFIYCSRFRFSRKTVLRVKRCSSHTALNEKLVGYWSRYKLESSIIVNT